MSRDWCFTDFDTSNYDDKKFSNIRYICYGIEFCPETNKEHKQGFVIFNRTCRVPKCKEWMGRGPGVHVEPRRGTRDEAREYCFKSGGSKYEWGEYDAMTKEALFKKSKRWLLDNGYDEFYCRFFRAIQEKQPKGDKWRNVHVVWLWGEPGSGKTRKVMEMQSVYKWDSPYQWFDGYEGEDILLIDDYEPGEVAPRVLKNVLDGYQYKLNIKGGHTYALWTKVYITSNYDFYELPESTIKGMDRRIHDVINL